MRSRRRPDLELKAFWGIRSPREAPHPVREGESAPRQLPVAVETVTRRVHVCLFLRDGSPRTGAVPEDIMVPGTHGVLAAGAQLTWAQRGRSASTPGSQRRAAATHGLPEDLPGGGRALCVCLCVCVGGRDV